jgi:hypothetical protein
VVLNIADRSVARTFTLPGQPDSIAISRDGRYAAIAIEKPAHQRDTPCRLAARFGGYRESRFRCRRLVNAQRGADVCLRRWISPPIPNRNSSINNRNEAAVTLQENNGIAIINLASGTVTRYFSAGRTTHAADLQDNGAIAFTDTLTNARRQPTA